MSETKNDIAWERIFKKYRILEKIKKNGAFEITSGQINEFREARLMTKFDHRGKSRIYAIKGSCRELLDLLAREDEIRRDMREILPQKVIKAFQTNKPVYFVHESLVRTVMEYIRSMTER